LSAQGFGLFYCTAQPGQVIDIRRIDALALELFSSDKALCRWVNGVRSRIRLQDPPTRVYWLSAPQQSELTAAIEQVRARGELKGSVTIGVCPTDFP
jgi:urocanate hydratase